MENNRKEVCPHCENHCSEDEIRCRRGAGYFGNEPQGAHKGHEGRGGHDSQFDLKNATTEDKILLSMRKCGHYLHHGGHENVDFLNALSDEEKQTLLSLLEKVSGNL